MKFSDIYGRIMGNRHSSDYDLESLISRDDAERDIQDANEFVTAAAKWLREEGWL